MESKDEFDALMQLSDFWKSRRDARYQSLLRISFGLWATLAAGVISLKHRPPDALLILVLVALVCGHALFIWTEILRNWFDVRKAFYYAERAENLLSETVTVREKPTEIAQMSWIYIWIKRRPSEYRTAFYWLLPTVLLSLIAYTQLGISNSLPGRNALLPSL